MIRHVNQFDFAALSYCIVLLPFGLLDITCRLRERVGDRMVKGEGGGRREESVIANKGGGELRKLTAREGRGS